MREVLLKNKEILDRLDGFIDTIISLDINDLEIKEINLDNQVQS